MTNLTILNSAIRTFDNFYSLNDLHRASGDQMKHRPSLFMRLETTKELIEEMHSENSQRSDSISGNIFKVIRGGADCSICGYWACEELVLAYAIWISPKFHLIVLRAFLAMHKNQALQQPQQPALPEPEMIEIDYDILKGVVLHSKLAKKHAEQLEPVMRKMFEMLGIERHRRNHFAAQAYDLAHEFNYWIREAEKTIERHEAKAKPKRKTSTALAQR